MGDTSVQTIQLNGKQYYLTPVEQQPQQPNGNNKLLIGAALTGNPVAAGMLVGQDETAKWIAKAVLTTAMGPLGIFANYLLGKDKEPANQTIILQEVPQEPVQIKEEAQKQEIEQLAQIQNPVDTETPIQEGDNYWLAAEAELKEENKDNTEYKPSDNEIKKRAEEIKNDELAANLKQPGEKLDLAA